MVTPGAHGHLPVQLSAIDRSVALAVILDVLPQALPLADVLIQVPSRANCALSFFESHVFYRTNCF